MNIEDVIKWLVLLALFPQIIGHSLLNWSLGVFPVHLVSLSLLGELIGSTIMAMIFLREYPAAYEVMSGLVIIVGIFIAISEPKKANS